MSWEVWTMKSRTSFFDWTLLKKNVSRFAPAWALLTLALFLSGPMPLMRRISRSGTRDAVLDYAEGGLDNWHIAGILLGFLAAVVFAALVFKYLHRANAAYMMHAFPMSRSCLFVTNGLSGLLFWLVPALVNVLLVQIILGVTGGSLTARLWTMLGWWLLDYLLFYGLAVFTMHISGNTVIAVLSYGALNFIVMLLPLLCMLLLRYYFYGFDYEVSDSILCLAPIVELLAEQDLSAGIRWAYAILALLLIVLAWLHYRRRHVERAGDPMAFGWARLAFRLVFTLCCAMGLGWMLMAFFGLFGDGRVSNFLPYALLGTFLGWFGSSMMVERTVKVFRKKQIWLGFGIYAAVLILAVLGLKYDLLGLQHRVPEAAQLSSVEIWTNGDYDYITTDRISLTEPEDLELIRGLHNSFLKRYDREKEESNFFADSYHGAEVHILYHLKGGGTLRRCYSTGSMSEMEQLRQLYSRPDIAAAWYERVIPEPFLSVTLEGTDKLEYDPESDTYYAYSEERECRAPEKLRAAVLADAAAGRLPIINSFTVEQAYPEDWWKQLPELYPETALEPGNQMGDVPVFNSVGELALNYHVYASGRASAEWIWIRIAPTATETLALFQ